MRDPLFKRWIELARLITPLFGAGFARGGEQLGGAIAQATAIVPRKLASLPNPLTRCW